jgi:hypothetical protein
MLPVQMISGYRGPVQLGAYEGDDGSGLVCHSFSSWAGSFHV